MIKVEVIEKFTLQDYEKLVDVKRKSGGKKPFLYVGDTFKCDKKMADYLLGENKLKKAFVKIIEVEPKEDSKVICEDKEVEKLFEEKPKKKKTSKK